MPRRVAQDVVRQVADKIVPDEAPDKLRAISGLIGQMAESYLKEFDDHARKITEQQQQGILSKVNDMM